MKALGFTFNVVPFLCRNLLGLCVCMLLIYDQSFQESTDDPGLSVRSPLSPSPRVPPDLSALLEEVLFGVNATESGAS